MGEFIGRVYVTLKSGVPDASGDALVKTLHDLGFKEVTQAKSGKYLEVTLEARSLKHATQQIEEMNTTFFANPVIEVATTERVGRVPTENSQKTPRRIPKTG